MKVVFVASLKSVSASGHQRLWAMRMCGLDVYLLNKDTYGTTLGRFAGRFAKLFKKPSWASDTKKLQHDVLQVCIQNQPDIVWLEWPKEFQPNILKKIKEQCPKAILVSMQDDNPWGDRINDKWMWKDYFKTVPVFDVHIVKRDSDCTHLKALGAKKTITWEHGMYSPLFYPKETTEEKKYPVSFVGTCMDQRITLLTYLLEKGIPIHIFGNGWDARSDLPKRFPLHFHSAVEGDAYAEVIRHSQICLGLVSHSNQDEWTMRSYEVPACAALLLAERTPTHERLFTQDINAVFFSTKEECASKLLTLLPQAQLCSDMGKTAHEIFIRHKYTIEARMESLMEQLKN